MATAIIHKRGVPDASGYYALFPSEPVSASESMAIRKTEPLDPWHFPGLLATMLQAGAKDKDILIVAHGTADGLGIPLVPDAAESIVAQYQQLNVLASNRPLKEKALVCKITEQQVKSICEQMGKVRKLGLNRVEFRACSMGQSTLTLEAYQEFFGAKSVGAPDYLDFFGPVDPGRFTSDDKTWKQWLAARGTARRFKLKSGEVAVHLLARKLSMLASSPQAVGDWIATCFPPATRVYQQGTFPIHALVNSGFFFPREAGYALHIKRYAKGSAS